MTDWTPTKDKLPTGVEREMLLWVVWPEMSWPAPPEPIVGWWKHGPRCFCFEGIENGNHLVTHWAEITEPTP